MQRFQALWTEAFHAAAATPPQQRPQQQQQQQQQPLNADDLEDWFQEHSQLLQSLQPRLPLLSLLCSLSTLAEEMESWMDVGSSSFSSSMALDDFGKLEVAVTDLSKPSAQSSLGANVVPYLLWLYLSLPVLQDVCGNHSMQADEDTDGTTGEDPKTPTVETAGDTATNSTTDHAIRLTKEQRQLWQFIRQLSESIETYCVAMYWTEGRRRKVRLSASHVRAQTTATTTTTTAHGGAVHRPVRETTLRNILQQHSSIYHRMSAWKLSKSSSTASVSSSSSTPAAPGSATVPDRFDSVTSVRHVITHHPMQQMDDRIIAVTPGTLPKILECLVQVVEFHVGEIGQTPSLHVDSLMVFCLAAQRLLATDYAHTPVPYCPEPGPSVLLSLPTSLLRFYRQSVQIWSQLQIMNSGIAVPATTYEPPTPHLARRMRSTSVTSNIASGSLGRNSFMGTLPTRTGRMDSLRRATIYSVNRTSPISPASLPPVSPTHHRPPPINTAPPVTAAFRNATRIPITRETGRAILSVLFYILRHSRVLTSTATAVGGTTLHSHRSDNRATWNGAAVSDGSPWQAAFVPIKKLGEETRSPTIVIPTQSSMVIDDDGATARERRSPSVVSFGIPIQDDRSHLKTAVVPGETTVEETDEDSGDASVEDIAVELATDNTPTIPTSSRPSIDPAWECLQALAKRTLQKLKLRARYEMWWEVVMAADQVPDVGWLTDGLASTSTGR